MKSTRYDLGGALALMLLVGCGSDTIVGGPGSGDDDATDVDGGSSPAADAAQAAAADARPTVNGGGRDGSIVRGDGSSAGEACATVRATTNRLPVHLAFAFDVSGSMGKGDEDWHDKSLKWDPVVKATRAFFEAETGADQAAPELSASLTFFPADDDKCELDSYTAPQVPMTELPSSKFSEAIAAIEPKSEDDWRGGTPTLFALRGTRTFVELERQKKPGKYAIVLVTDGYPQGCDDEEDSIEAVVAEAKVALAAGISTYVIGVANPKLSGAPDTVSNLGQVAVAGGTERAFLIDTGDPQSTTSAFDNAIARIREATLSCNLAIPQAPDGRPFDKRRVLVRSAVRGTGTVLSYDAACKAANGWRYDNETAPKEIVLCPDACAAVENQLEARVDVDFACEDVLLL
jgi:hypothetical protein